MADKASVPERVVPLLGRAKAYNEWSDTHGTLHGPGIDHDITAQPDRLQAEAAADHREQDGVPRSLAAVAAFWAILGAIGFAASLMSRCSQ